MVSQPESPQAQPQTDPPSKDERPPVSPLGDLHVKLAELLDYFLYYITASIDSLKFAIKRRIFVAWVIAVAVLAGAGVVVTAVVLLCEGICDGLSELLGRRWAGELATGILLIIIVAGVAYFALRQLARRLHRKMSAKYEAIHARQRERFGRDAAQNRGEPNG
jgi:hypothetical protein